MKTKAPRVIDMQRRGLFWFNYDRMRISGWSFDIDEGDEVRSKMESGRTGRFRVVKMDRMLDPRDQFFATVEPIGYVE